MAPGTIPRGENRRRRPFDLLRLFPLPPQPVPPPPLRIPMQSAQPEVCAFASFDTHLPNAFAPFGWFAGAYFALNAAMLSAVVPRSFLHAFAALSWASALASASVSDWSVAIAETHLPYAFGLVP